MAGVLCSAKDYDGIRRVQFLERSLVHDANRGHDEKRGQDQQRQGPEPQQPAGSRMPVNRIVAHPLAKKVEISSAGIAPSRMTRQRTPSSLRSMMVEAMSRGEVPPSTIMLMRP